MKTFVFHSIVLGVGLELLWWEKHLVIGELLTIIYQSPLIIMGRHNAVINGLKFLYYVCCIVFASRRWEFFVSSFSFMLTKAPTKGVWLSRIVSGWWELLKHRLSGISDRRWKISNNNNLSRGYFLFRKSTYLVWWYYPRNPTLRRRWLCTTWRREDFEQTCIAID